MQVLKLSGLIFTYSIPKFLRLANTASVRDVIWFEDKSLFKGVINWSRSIIEKITIKYIIVTVIMKVQR